MNTYLILYRAPKEAMQKMVNANQKVKEAGMQVWLEWKKQAGAALIEFGSPLINGKYTLDGKTFSDSTDDISGYSIMRANTDEQLEEMLENHPHYKWHEGCQIEYKKCY